MDGHTLTEIGIPGIGLITDAHLLGDAWLVLARDGADKDILLRIPSATTTGIDTILAELSDLRPHMRRLSGDNALAILSEVRFPYAIQGIRTDGGMTSRALIQNPSAVAEAIDAKDSSRWLAMPYLPIDSLLLHTRSDLTSDQRVHSLLRMDGTVVRARSAHVPLAFIALSASNEQVVAARQLNSVELVWYKWRWGAKLELSKRSR